jgi:hypothetical protein
MSNQTKRHFIALLFLIAFTTVKGQTNKISANDGIWQDYGPNVSASTYPEIHGRLVNINWSDIETSNNTWKWTTFDSDVNAHIADNMPVIILVYTGPGAPDWIYYNGTTGIPKVIAKNNAGDSVAYSPYYLDSNYNRYFKRMITNVRQHIQSYPSSTKNLIIAMQGCYGSTGDQITYKGTVAPQYQITSGQFDSLFKVYSLYYYNEYKNNIPSIRLLSNPSPTDSSQTNWLMNNCPGGWIKCGTFAKGSQINMESDKQKWMYNILNQPQNGQFVMARSEVVGPHLSAGWWTKNHYKEMFGIMCYSIYWGLDWPNETADFIKDPKYDSTFAFFNKYAGQKIPGLATNAVCALKDALDASDSTRFPSSIYGAVTQDSVRYKKIYNDYRSYGAKLEDVSAVLNNDLGCLTATGTNDVGWHLLPDNYERYLHQINADSTSAGYWNVNSSDSNSMYGRYARGFDTAHKKNALYFDVDDNFLRNAPLNGAYPVTIEITYLDSGKGSWRLFYDAVGNNNKGSVKVTDSSTNAWKKCKVVLSDANFGNKSINGSDFYIKNVSNPNQNVIFSVIELSRTQLADSGFITTALDSFDTVGINSIIPPHSFVLHAANLDSTKVQIGPLNNCSFSTSATGNFTSSFILSNHGKTINQTIYVKINTTKAVTIFDSIPITGGGKKKAIVYVNGTVVNSSPVLNAVVTNLTCHNSKNGSIDLQPTGGMDSLTFVYKWTKDSSKWSATTQDIDSLQPGNYTVVINSDYGCSTSKTFIINNSSLYPPITPRIRGPQNVTSQQTGIIYYVANVDTSSNYSWNISGGSITSKNSRGDSIIVTWGTSDGSISVSASNGCANSDLVTLYVALNTGLRNNSNLNMSGITANKLPADNAITLMPNPVRDVATVQFSTATSEAYSIMISDMNGRLLATRKKMSLPGINLEKFDVSNFSAGVYFITLIEQTGEKRTARMIKQ